MAEDSDYDLPYVLPFLSSFFFCFVTTELRRLLHNLLYNTLMAQDSAFVLLSEWFFFYSFFCFVATQFCCLLRTLLMAQNSTFDLLSELFFFSSLFFCFVVTELLFTEHPFISVRFFQHEDDKHVSFSDSGYPQQKNNSSSLHLQSPPPPSSPSSSSSSSIPDPETKHVKSSMKTEEPMEVICEICTEIKQITQMIKNQTCDHSYCSDCMIKHVATKVQDRITRVPCPGLDCKTVLEMEACGPWLPKGLLERWDQTLCDALFLQVPKFYCPFKDCSAMMLVENEEDQQAAGETECPVCHRMFCPRCKVPWHTGVDCKEYQELNENERQREDLLVRQLSKREKWGRCPKCKFYVEKTFGCMHITCRCKYEFCYECGKNWTSTHGAYCPRH